MIEQFRAAMREKGIVVSDPIIADGKLHRYHVEGDKPKSRNAWAVIHHDDHPAGMFGCHKRFAGEKFKWAMTGARPLTPDERKKLKAEARAHVERRRAEDQIKAEHAAARALAIYDAAAPATADHPYLKRKGVQPSDKLRIGNWSLLTEGGEERLVSSEALIAPIMDAWKKVHSLQAIFPDAENIYGRDRTYLRDGAKTGHFMSIGRPIDETILICEGLATGLSLHQCTGHAVIVAFDVGNLAAVGKVIREIRPGYRLLFCADNDAWTEQPVKNPGVHYATLAAHEVNADVIAPEFDDTNSKLSDFNDLHVTKGAASVASTVEMALSRRPTPSGRPPTEPQKAEPGGHSSTDTEWPIPVDILTQLSARPFSSEDFPTPLAEYALLFARASGIDRSVVLTAALSAAAAALTDEFKVCGDPETQWLQPARLWILTIGAPGSGKTPAQREMLAPLRSLHAELTAAYERALAEHEKRKGEASDEAEVEPRPPRPRVVVSDTTLEALGEVLRDNPRGIFIVAEEFDSWLGSLDQYRAGDVGRDRGHWLSIFDGGPHQVERIKRGSSYVPNWGASILTATTPAGLQRVSKHLPIDGLIQRFILVLARRVQLTVDKPAREEIESARERYIETIRRLWSAVPRAHHGVVPLSLEAAKKFQDAHQEYGRLQEALGSIEPAIEAHIAKFPTMLLRIALIFHAAVIVNHEHPNSRDIASFPISGDTMALAQSILKRATQHAMVVYLGREGGSETYELARSVARFILARLDTSNAAGLARRDLVQRVHSFRRADDRVQVASLKLLVDLGWLRETGGEGEYQKSSPARYDVNPRAAQLFATMAQQERERRAIAREQIADAVAQRREGVNTGSNC